MGDDSGGARGSEKRAYTRLPLRLGAQLWGPSWAPRAGQIRDFCPGGVFVACAVHPDDPSNEERTASDALSEVTIEFSLVDEKLTTIHTVSARVARSFEGGVGLSFVDPDARAIAGLEALSERQLGEGAGHATGPSEFAPSERGAVRAACRDLAANELASFLASTLKRAEPELLLAARDAGVSSAQQKYFDALNTIDRGRPSIESAYRELVERHFHDLGQPLAALERVPEPASASALSLVDKDEFEGFLVVSDMVARAEATNEATLFELNRRFDHLCDTRILNDNNPVGPLAVCHTFRHVVRALEIAPEASRVLYAALGDQVARELSGVFAIINDFLSERGVPTTARYRDSDPPEPKVDPRTGRAARARSAPGVDAGAPPGPSRESAVAPGAGWSRYHPDGEAPARVPAGSPNAPEAPGAHVPAEAADPATTFGFEVRASQPVAPHERGAPAAFGAAQALFGIQRRQSGLATMSGEGARVDGYGPEFGLEEVLDALARIVPAAGASGSLRERLLSVLSGQTGGLHKRLGDDVADAIELVEELFRAIGDDGHVQAGMKPRIAGLEAVIQRIVLTDQSFLTAREHPIRRLLNGMGELDPEALAARDPTESSPLDELLDPVLEVIAAQSEQAAPALGSALASVEALLEGQHEAYESRRARVVKMCEDQQTFVKARRASDVVGGSGREEAGQAPSKEWGVWLSRAKRLKPGDEVEVADALGAARRRVRLAWIGESFSPFVFVDRRGEKDATLSLQELAMNLRRGLVVAVDRPVLPLVDRAMYAVLHQVHGRIERQAHRDPITGLGNRRTFESALDAALRSASQDHELEHALGEIALLGLDEVETRGGVSARHAVLQEVGAVVREHLGEGVPAARLEGETFVFLLEDTSSRRTRRAGQRLRREIEDHRYLFEGERHYVQARIGAAMVSYLSQGVEPVLTEASLACQEALDAADGDTAVREPPEPESDGRPPMMEWATLINRTLGEDRMQLRCQQVKPTDDRGKPYQEILLGLRDDDGRAIAPSEFITAVEYYEQSAALDRWVIRNALRWMAANRRLVRDAAGFTIKLTGRSVADENLMEFLLEQLTDSAVPPGKVCLEINAADAVANAEPVGRLVRTLGEFGCRFSLSKFTGGEGAHERLEAIPADFLKLDGRFVRDMLTSENDLAVVQSANELAHASGLRTVAEFVENAETLERLRAMGVDFVQGLYVEAPRYLTDLGPAPIPSSGPESEADFDALLAEAPVGTPDGPSGSDSEGD